MFALCDIAKTVECVMFLRLRQTHNLTVHQLGMCSLSFRAPDTAILVDDAGRRQEKISLAALRLVSHGRPGV
jgi:hypothetical protein